LNPFKDWGKTKFYLNIASDYPTTYVSKNINEKLISDLEQSQIESKQWIIHPRNPFDKIIFSGYVENLLQVAITVLESDSDSFANIFSEGASKIAEILKSGGTIPGKVFPFLGIATLVFSGIASLIKDQDDFIGSVIYQLRRDTTFPICKPLVCHLKKGSDIIGEVDLAIYIKPDQSESASFYHDVEIFPLSSDEIGVYYSGDITESKQIYMIWTLDNWKSNPLVKMKRMGKYWVGIIEIPPSMMIEHQLELAFTDDDGDWDNKDGNNWIFQNFRWS